MMEQPDPLWKTIFYTTAVLSLIAAVTTTVKAIRTAYERSKGWLSNQVAKGAELRKAK